MECSTDIFVVETLCWNSLQLCDFNHPYFHLHRLFHEFPPIPGMHKSLNIEKAQQRFPIIYIFPIFESSHLFTLPFLNLLFPTTTTTVTSHLASIYDQSKFEQEMKNPPCDVTFLYCNSISWILPHIAGEHCEQLFAISFLSQLDGPTKYKSFAG